MKLELKNDRNAGKLLENSEVSNAGDWLLSSQQNERRSVGFWRAFSRLLVRSARSVRREPSVSGRSNDAYSETELGELRVERSNTLVFGSLGAGIHLLGLECVEGSGLDLSLLFESSDNILLGPAGKGGEITERHELPLGLQAESLEGVWHNHALLLVVGEGHAFEDLQLTESGGATSELVGEHATDALPENARRGPPVLVTAAGVRVNTLLHNILTNDLVSLDPAGLDDLLSTHNSDALASQKLLGNNAGETALEVAPAVDNQLLFEHA